MRFINQVILIIKVIIININTVYPEISVRKKMNTISQFMNNNYYSIIIEFLIIQLALLIEIKLLEITSNFLS